MNQRNFLSWSNPVLPDHCSRDHKCPPPKKRDYLLYILTSFCVLHTPSAGWNPHFQRIKNVNLSLTIRKKAVFWELNLRPAFWCKLKSPAFWQDFGANFLLFMFFNFWAQKTLKTHISTSVWHGQHPNAGQNIQQIFFESLELLQHLLVGTPRTLKVWETLILHWNQAWNTCSLEEQKPITTCMG